MPTTPNPNAARRDESIWYARAAFAGWLAARKMDGLSNDDGEALTAVQDMISDLLHLADTIASTPDFDEYELLGRARRNYQAERDEAKP